MTQSGVRCLLRTAAAQPVCLVLLSRKESRTCRQQEARPDLPTPPAMANLTPALWVSFFSFPSLSALLTLSWCLHRLRLWTGSVYQGRCCLYPWLRPACVVGDLRQMQGKSLCEGGGGEKGRDPHSSLLRWAQLRVGELLNASAADQFCKAICPLSSWPQEG